MAATLTTTRPFGVRDVEGRDHRFGSLMAAVTYARKQMSSYAWAAECWSVVAHDTRERYVVRMDSVTLVPAF